MLNWYNQLIKPEYIPSPEIFSIVWAVLYLLMLISFIALFRFGLQKNMLNPIILFVTQLILNLYWVQTFFVFHNIFTALIVAILLWVIILLTILSFHKYSKLSAYLLIPYLLWVSFAIFLNYKIYILNI